MKRSTAVISALTLTAAAGLLVAGPLNPPAGPVASSYKTLSEVEPRTAINYVNTPGDNDSVYKITQPGSYYLTGNVQGALSRYGIEIAASNVTIDLMGFELTGFGSLDGISVTIGGLTDIAVLNGTVRSFNGAGVNLYSSANARVEGVLASNNGSEGIRTGNGSVIRDCTAHTNGGFGIFPDYGCTVENCAAYDNTATGINAGPGCTMNNCSAYSNGGMGLFVNSASTMTNCSAAANTSSGIETAIGCTVAHCSSMNNDGTGIDVLWGSNVSDCAVSGNAAGIVTSNGCTVADCTLLNNTLDSIVCNYQCVIRGNSCAHNGGSGTAAGIHATAGDNRIEGNNCIGAGRGILVDAPGNIIVRNSCSGNAIDWVIAANNVFGPIVDRRTPASAAVSGFSAASTLGSTDPNANFSY